jgi:hypothetical protein
LVALQIIYLVHFVKVRTCLWTAPTNGPVVHLPDEKCEAPVEWYWQGTPKTSERNMYQCHFAHQKHDMNFIGRDRRLNSLSSWHGQSFIWLSVYAFQINHHDSSQNFFFFFLCWRWGGCSTQAWRPTYVSILRIPQIWFWRATVELYIDREKTEKLGENLSYYHFVHHKSHMDWPRREPWPPRLEAGD